MSRKNGKAAAASNLCQDGEVPGLIAFGDDITEHRKAEELQARLLEIIEATPDFISTCNANKQPIYFNRAARRLLGFDEDENLSNITIPETHPQWANEIVLSIGIPTAEREGYWRGESALLSRDGREIPVSQVIIAHKNALGQVEFMSTIARDITKPKRIKEALQKANEELRGAYAELEERIVERTAELARANEELQSEIAERKMAEENLKQSLEKLRKTMTGTVEAMALTSELRDPYTAGHQRRVADVARAVAREMGLSQDQIDGIHLAAVIHDIGKICVPAEILSKPGKISEIEFSLIKAHPQVGYDILKRIEFPWPIAQIVLQHHEKIDGSGYPQGLTGEDILLEARVLCVADVVEAIASHRPYRPSRGVSIALEEISQHRGILYDPAIVDACLRVFNDREFQFD